MTEAQVVTVILGAGASYDIADPPLPVNPEYQPPLTQALFDLPNRPWLLELANELPGVHNLLPELRRAAGGSTRGLETRLSELASDQHPVRRQWYLDVPAFLQAQIADVSSKYLKLRAESHERSPGAGNLQRLVNVLLHDDTPRRVVFITLNYDEYLEQALQIAGYPISMMGDYARQAWPWRMAKLHGSIDWFEDLTTAWERDDTDFPRNWRQALRAFEIDDFDRTVTLVPGVTRVWRGGAPFRYPILTAPVGCKSLEGSRCPRPILDSAAEWLRASKRTLVIGTSGNDEDLGLLLQKFLPPQDVVHIVAKETESDGRLLRSRFLPSITSIGDGSGMQVFLDGFRDYLWDGGLDTFLGKRKNPLRGLW